MSSTWQNAAKIKAARIRAEGEALSDRLNAVYAQLRDLVAHRRKLQTEIERGEQLLVALNGSSPLRAADIAEVKTKLQRLTGERADVDAAIAEAQQREQTISTERNAVVGLANQTAKALERCGIAPMPEAP